MNPVDDPEIRELANRAMRLLRTLPLGEPFRGSWIREIEHGPYRIVLAEPVELSRESTLDICKGTTIIYRETYTNPGGTKRAAEALKYLRQNMALEDLADVRE
jgi:hypothetical protein